MDSHVSTVALKIRAPAGMHTGASAIAEGFARRVLERCDELLERRWPGVMFFVRDLDLSLRLLEGHLDDTREVDAVAGAIADHIEAEASFETAAADAPSRSADAEVVAFRDEIEWRAVHLETWAQGSSGAAWLFAPLEADEEPLVTLTSVQHHRRLWCVLSCLDHRGTLRATLAALPPRIVVRIAETLGTADDGAVSAEESLTDRFSQQSVRDGVAAEVARAVDARSLGPTPKSTESLAASCTIWPSVLSAFGGAVYLLNVALELSIGEALWRACLPEGRIFARAVAGIMGARDDAAPRILGGAPVDDEEPVVTREQQREVAIALLHALVDALPRRGLAMLPAPSLGAIDTKHGRLFVATAIGAPFVFFAMPAESPADMRAALELFLSVWPVSAPPPGRARALEGTDGRAVIAAGSSAASALLSQLAGTLSLVFATRVGFVARGSAAAHEQLTERYLTVPSLIVDGAEAIDVRMPMESIEVAVRRAGLDRDPGWVPWLARTVIITFSEQVEGGGIA
jgi:hypothetical protein